jgi:hypothetical protein
MVNSITFIIRLYLLFLIPIKYLFINIYLEISIYFLKNFELSSKWIKFFNLIKYLCAYSAMKIYSTFIIIILYCLATFSCFKYLIERLILSSTILVFFSNFFQFYFVILILNIYKFLCSIF